MSSFVISKSEYMKAAGFLAGLAAEKDCYREQLLRMWNSKDNRVMNDQDFIDAFTTLYNFNALSVQKQYKDNEPEADKNTYAKEFKAAKKATQQMVLDWHLERNRNVEMTIYKFQSFSSSILYQIEDPELSDKARFFLAKVQMKLFEVLRNFNGISEEDTTSWGDFNIA